MHFSLHTSRLEKVLKASFCFILLCALLGACDSGAPELQPELQPSSARPFEVVSVLGISANYAAGAPVEITVGGIATMLSFDPVGEAHNFLLPDVAPGQAAVVLPAALDGQDVTLQAEVLPTVYLGGSPEAAIAQTNELLDSLQVEATIALGVLSPEQDAFVYDRLDALITFAEALQDQVDELSDEDRTTMAALYTAQGETIEELTGYLFEALDTLQEPYLILPGANRSVPPPLPASAVVASCLQHLSELERLEEFQRAAFAIHLLAIATTFVNPLVGVALKIMAVHFSFAIDIASIILNSIPRLLDTDGLRFQASPVFLAENGGIGTMTAFVNREPTGDILGGFLGATSSLFVVKQAIQGLEQIRLLTNNQLILHVLREAGLTILTEIVEELLNIFSGDYFREALGSLSGDVQVTFEGIQVIPGAGADAWEFTDGTMVTERAFQTVGTTSIPELNVEIAGQLGAGDDCGAATASAQPALGKNGFIITGVGGIAFGHPSPEVELRAGESVTVALAIQNHGTGTVGPLSYQFGDPNQGPWQAQPGLTISTPTGPSQMGSMSTSSVQFSITAAPEAFPRTILIPVSAWLDGSLAAVVYVPVALSPQLSDVVVNQENSSIRLWDHEVEDGDLVTVTLNGSPIVTSHFLTNAGTVFPVHYRFGRNVLVIHALNEGSLSPNTASISFADVVQGPKVQQYGLPTGATVQLVITYDPDAFQAASTNGALPLPTLRSCESALERGCPN